MLIKPKFYDQFECKASACRHTCCAGWDIPVEPETVEIYKNTLTDAEKSKLIHDGDEVYLCREGGKCGFLREDGLCELIIRHTESALCEICREHPRFNTCTEGLGICELGVGISCERAAELWLESDPEFIEEEDDYTPDESELEMLAEQKRLVRRALDGEFPTLDFDRLKGVYESLELLEPMEFTRQALPDTAGRLMAYYIYRWYFEYPEKAWEFAAANVLMTAALGGDFIDAARRLSCEVEYDPDNTERIMKAIGQLCSAT